jgi:hypothetical protein
VVLGAFVGIKAGEAEGDKDDGTEKEEEEEGVGEEQAT